jgi:integrase
MRGIYKRGNVWWICYVGVDGRIIRESSESDKFQDAKTKLAARRNTVEVERKQPEIKKIPNYSFQELADNYLVWVTGRQNSAKVKAYIIKPTEKTMAKKTKIRKAPSLIERFGNLPLRRFSTALVEQYQTNLINAGLKNASINKIMNVLRHMFSKAVDWEMVESEVLKKIRKVKLFKEDRRLRYLSKEECRTLLHHCEGHLKSLVIMALNSGMRRGEILGLKWDHVDLKHGFILLDKTKNGERREIPINATLRAVLEKMPRHITSPYVFSNPETGKQFTEVKRSFATATRRARITDFHFHDLRHTFASHLVMAGVDLTTVSRLLGHKDIKMTLRYSHLAPAHMVKAVDILDQTINEKPAFQSTSQFTSQSTKKEAMANA